MSKIQNAHQYQPAPISVSENGTNVKLPMINNFSSTLDYKKRSREAINEQKHLKSAALGANTEVAPPSGGKVTYDLNGPSGGVNQAFYNSVQAGMMVNTS